MFACKNEKKSQKMEINLWSWRIWEIRCLHRLIGYVGKNVFHRVLFEKKCTINVGVSIFAEATIEFSEDSNFHIESEDQGLCLKYSYLELKDDTKLPLITKLLVSLYPKGLPAIRIKTAARSPKGAGLGGSSSLAFTVAGGLVKFREAQDGFSLSERDLVKLMSEFKLFDFRNSLER